MLKEPIDKANNTVNTLNIFETYYLISLLKSANTSMYVGHLSEASTDVTDLETTLIGPRYVPFL